MEPDSGSGPFFQNCNYIASDYYYSNLEGDEHQDIAVGRVVGRSVTDAHLLAARSLGFDEYGYVQFEVGNDVSERFYDTFSEDWKLNAGVFIGAPSPCPCRGPSST
jgi:hypothetical protein